MIQYSLTQKNKQYNALGIKNSKTTFYLGSPFPEDHVIIKYWSFYCTIFLTCEGVQKLNRDHKRFEKMQHKGQKT